MTGEESEVRRAIGIIPARWGSTRFPGKSLAPILGRPLIGWVVERVRLARRLSDVAVATDDERIRRTVEDLGVRAIMTRADHPSGTDRVAEAAAGSRAEVVVNIQGDEPMVDPGLIDRLVDAMLEDASWDMATAAAPVRNAEELSSPSVVKVVWGDRGQALYFSRSVIPFVRDAEPGRVDRALHWRHLGIYAYRADFLARLVRTPESALEKAERLEQLRALHVGARIRVVQTDDSGIGIDTPQDIPYVERLIRGATSP
jgi:3-deoxy-manno-octulosonate cytidylyltransferase (CMP-KDO synthetase)